ncbi:SDR family NAD(P)-dependent oxidoreductase [Sphingosinithalassobacter portus]|uniref:SDR family NAD(P)-dependent oxidoreductase n=1 Tax=Stakelama portus TaxID=2676234 RepID=UPI00137AAF7A|nr:SDR family oxidoreductase [Sphingosinithalassobacter portus]
MQLNDKVIVVTGGRGGIGLATTRKLTEEGAQVIWTDLNDEVIGDPVEGAIFFKQDVGEPADWQALETFVNDTFGRLDGLVNNAGIYMHDSIFDTTIESYRKLMRVNAEGPLLGCQMALRTMKSGGAIVNVASAAGIKPGPLAIAYGMSKAAVLNLTEAVATQGIYTKNRIRCNAVCPGAVDTPMTHIPGMDRENNPLLDMIRSRSITGDIAKASDIANVAAFLLSDQSAYVTGRSIAADGGFLIC